MNMYYVHAMVFCPSFLKCTICFIFLGHKLNSVTISDLHMDKKKLGAEMVIKVAHIHKQTEALSFACILTNNLYTQVPSLCLCTYP